jgi:hypothetical protein
MAEGVATADGRLAQPFTWPEQVPWSQLGPEFIETWGRREDGRPDWEHLEVTGQSGSGKSYAIATILQDRAARWNTAELVTLSKNTDDSIPLLGWPVVGDYEQLRNYRQAIFWPKTELVGQDKETFHERAFYELLSRLWPKPGELANCVVYLDEVRYLERLPGPTVGQRQRLRKLIRQYWREGRSHGLSVIAGAQRPVDMVRDQHSESRWKIVFPPADAGDMQRFAELLGRPADWAPVLDSLDQRAHQFILRNSYTKDAYISWIDAELRPLPSQAQETAGDHTPPGAPYGSQAPTITNARTSQG